MMNALKGLLLLLACCLVLACGEETSILPKPRAFPKVEYPMGKPEPFALTVCPFTFSKPSYARVERDTAFFEESPRHPCWFDLVTPSLNGRVHFSYYAVEDLADFEKFRDDAFVLAGKHNLVASYIDERPIDRPAANVHGFAFDLEGDVASPFQFFVSDSSRHFLRGSLYVNAKASADSLAPVYAFLREDLLQAIATLEWR